MKNRILLIALLVGIGPTGLTAQDGIEPAEEAQRNLSREIVLTADDVAVFPVGPKDIATPRKGIEKGVLEMIEYRSDTVGATRRVNVYTPPEYDENRSYPVLYLLHGIGGDETEWHRFVRLDVLFDNLIADSKAVPMIVVMPNGRARKNDRAEEPIFSQENVEAFARFERDLLGDLIPAIESRYSISRDRVDRAVAGLSMGGGQALNFGLGHLETFAWVGAFSPAPNTKPPAELIPDPEEAAKKLKLLYLSCGNKDGLINISQGVHRYLRKRDIPHIWNVDDFGHDPETWRNNLYHFAQLVFQPDA